MRKAIIGIVVVASILVAASFGAGEVLSAPAKRIVGLPPAELAAETVTLDGNSNGVVSGWLSRGQPGLGAILLLHGIRSDRRQMIARSKFLHAAGYSVLLIDLPAHGESSGDRITFGFLEAKAVRAALHFLRETLPGERIAVIGVSLGAAAFVLADATPTPSAVILESMYPTIDEAVADRLNLRLGPLGASLAPVLLWQLPVRLGISAEQLRPIDHLSSLHAPVLIASGTADRHTTAAETKRLFDAAAAPKELWLVEGAAHVDLYAFNPKAYEARISAFLHRHLRNAGRPLDPGHGPAI
jgi:fermentation-respiration switch protein FrsA (DUF1100 family)